MNFENFRKMAHGDLASLRDLALEFFQETRRKIPRWQRLLDGRNYLELRDDLHRCKGGASLFGLERMVRLLGASESATVLETKGFDLENFADELAAAENALLALNL